jgi:hypothetical protein
MQYRESPLYNGVATHWFAMGGNSFEHGRARPYQWLQNLGGMATVAVSVLLVFGGVIAWRLWLRRRYRRIWFRTTPPCRPGARCRY